MDATTQECDSNLPKADESVTDEQIRAMTREEFVAVLRAESARVHEAVEADRKRIKAKRNGFFGRIFGRLAV